MKTIFESIPNIIHFPSKTEKILEFILKIYEIASSKAKNELSNNLCNILKTEFFLRDLLKSSNFDMLGDALQLVIVARNLFIA